MRLNRIHPDPGVTSPEQATSGLRLGDLAPEDRPYVVLNMVMSADGRASIGGRSGPIGDEADRELFHGLRTQVDAVLVGAGTVRTEGYGRLVKDAGQRARREREGFAADPLAVIASRSGNAGIPDQEFVIIEADSARLGALRTERGIRSILCEGGPTLNASLLAQGLVDEIFLSLAPKIAGGGEVPGIVTGPGLPEPAKLELLHVLEREGNLFLRYRLNHRDS
ncbi:MAG: dihydrofolate reductase family protein [Thermoleophilaceae bacterium]|nr:dihydrofolate reductase family protein [Thermoleophilaceae bacterium]